MSPAPGPDAPLAGTRAGAIRDEYLGNNACFPLANILLGVLRELAFNGKAEPMTVRVLPAPSGASR